MVRPPAGSSLEGSDLSPGSDPSLTPLHSQEGWGWGHDPHARVSAPGRERVPSDGASKVLGDAGAGSQGYQGSLSSNSD